MKLTSSFFPRKVHLGSYTELKRTRGDAALLVLQSSMVFVLLSRLYSVTVAPTLCVSREGKARDILLLFFSPSQAVGTSHY